MPAGCRALPTCSPQTQIACDTECDLELHHHNSAVGTENMTGQLCLIKVLQLAVLKYKYSSEWKMLFKINSVSAWAVLLVSAVSFLET